MNCGQMQRLFLIWTSGRRMSLNLKNHLIIWKFNFAFWDSNWHGGTPETVFYPWYQSLVTCCTPNRPISTCHGAKTPYIGPFYQGWYVRGRILTWRCCSTCVTKREVFHRWSTLLLSLYGSNLRLRVLLCYPYVYIFSFNAKTIQKVVTRLTFQMS